MARPLAAPAQLGAPRLASRGALPWLVLLALTAALVLASEAAPWAFKYPAAWIVPLKSWINALMSWLRDDASFGLFTFQELTRAISWLIEQPFRLVQSVLSAGFVTGFGESATLLWPPIPWFALIGALAVTAHHAGGRGLAWLVALCFLYLAVFGQWASAMVTLSSIVIAVPLGIVLGTLLGIAAFRHPRFERAITPFLDLMQTVPVFAYLVPILWFFGFNPVAAMIATIVYAMPPMVRNTVLALQRVPDEVTDFGHMAGCTRRQMMWKVLLPSARPGLMVGVNQVIMLSLNMVIIASMIGAGGLGHEVLAALRRLDFGAGLEAALAITLLAIALDRLSQAFARRPPPVHGVVEPSFVRRHPHLVAALALLLGGWALAALWPAGRALPAKPADEHRRCRQCRHGMGQHPPVRHHRGDQGVAPDQPDGAAQAAAAGPALARGDRRRGACRLAARRLAPRPADRLLRAVHRAYRQLAERHGDRLSVRRSR